MQLINRQMKKATRALHYSLLGIITAIGTPQLVSAQEREPIRAPIETPERTPVKLDGDGVLRLEATIRGDQQQPRVLSIVPWDSPPHRRISRVALTGEASNMMVPLHRHTFLQRIALHDQLKVAVSNAEESQ